MIGKTMLTLVAAIGISAIAIAQGAPRGGGHNTPQNGSMRQGPPAGPIMHPRLLSHPDVQKELKLSAEQIEKVEKMMPKPGNRAAGPGANGNGRAPHLMEEDIKSLLNAAQFKRFQEIWLQAAGPFAVLRPDIGEKLGITEQQRAEMFELMKKGREEDAGKQLGREQMMQRRDEIARSLLTVLNDGQMDKWRALLGKPFHFKPIR